MKPRLLKKNPKLVAKMATAGFTGRKLAKLTGISIPCISLIVTQRTTNPKPETVKKICEVLKCTPESIGLEVGHE